MGLESVLDQVMKHLRGSESQLQSSIANTDAECSSGQLPAEPSLGVAGAVSVFRGTRQSVTTRQMGRTPHTLHRADIEMGESY